MLCTAAFRRHDLDGKAADLCDTAFAACKHTARDGLFAVVRFDNAANVVRARAGRCRGLNDHLNAPLFGDK